MLTNIQARLELARHSPHYLGNPKAADNSVWKLGPDGETEYLVPKDDVDASTSGLQPTALKSICMIQRQGFFATPDFKFNPDKMPDWLKSMGATAAFRRGDMSFTIGAAPERDHPELYHEFEETVKNMDAIRKNALPRVSQIGCCIGEGMDTKYKISHAGFEDRESTEPPKINGQEVNQQPEDSASTTGGVDTPVKWELLDHDMDSPFRIVSLLPVVSPQCLPLLREIIPTTRFNPLPAVLEHDPSHAIAPAHYQSMLCGAIAEVSFTLAHKFVKRPGGKVSYFKATLDEVVILQLPTVVPEVPSKTKNKRLFCRTLNEETAKAGPSASKPTKRSRKA